MSVTSYRTTQRNIPEESDLQRSLQFWREVIDTLFKDRVTSRTQELQSDTAFGSNVDGNSDIERDEGLLTPTSWRCTSEAVCDWFDVRSLHRTPSGLLLDLTLRTSFISQDPQIRYCQGEGGYCQGEGDTTSASPRNNVDSGHAQRKWLEGSAQYSYNQTAYMITTFFYKNSK
jgi:hypothetical protein